MKIDLYTPWPPQRSGIADYAYRLARGLLAHKVDVEVFTAAASPEPLDGCAIHVLTEDPVSLPASEALPVFQLGNNVAFHAFQPRALARLGGLVHLHDPVLHHLHVDRTLAAGEGGYWDDLEFWYGRAIVDACQRMVELDAAPWSNAAVTAIPLFEPYLQFADAVVVHSLSALQTIRERMPALRGFYLTQSYPLDLPAPHAPRPPGHALRLGVFGWIEPHKRIDQILAAMAELRRRGVDIRLDICGPAGATMGELVHQIRGLGLSSVVELRGHLAHQEFIAEIAAVDLCVNLRDPTMGETSAVVTQAMQLGTPVIVTDVGWYAELPDFALKVPPGPDAVEALVSHLARLDQNRELLSLLAEATRRYAATDLDFDAVIERYVGILAELALERARRRTIDGALYREAAVALMDLDLTGSTREKIIGARILDALRPCF